MVDIAVMLGADRTDAMIKLNESLSFEINLARVSLKNKKLIIVIFSRISTDGAIIPLFFYLQFNLSEFFFFEFYFTKI